MAYTLANPVDGHVYPYKAAHPAGTFVVTQPFGCTGYFREPAGYGCDHYHRGLDIASGQCGQRVLAMAAGRVQFSGVTSDGASVIWINIGGGTFVLVAHLSARLVGTGQQVARSQLIGKVGSSGNSTACHVHVSVKTGVTDPNHLWTDGNGRWEDPEKWLAQNAPTPSAKRQARPKGAGIFIRREPTTGAPAFAKTMPDGNIHAGSQGERESRGPTDVWRATDGDRLGTHWEVPKPGGGTITGNTWTRLWLDGGWRYVASGLVDKRTV